jgi:adenosylcobinamide-phosphate synthase
MLRIWLVIGLDLVFKDPQFLYHPVRFFGLLIQQGEKWVRAHVKEEDLRKAGVLLVFGVVAVVLMLYGTIKAILTTLHPVLGLVFDIYLAYALLASGSLMAEGKRIYDILKAGDLEAARTSLSYLVSRDTKTLSLRDILRGAVETLSENITDGIVSPLFYYGLFGVPGLLVFKIISTFDSMIGYKNKQYIDLGRFAAQFDDVLNFIPARLAGVLVILVARVIGENHLGAYQIFMRDRLKHASPNSACTESAVAGALGIKLGGGSIYFGEKVEKPEIGDGIWTEDPDVLIRTNRLILGSTLLMGVLLSIVYSLRGVISGF